MTRRKTSWQWQLVLIMMLVSGLALLSFIGVLWQIVSVTTIKKIDAELVAFSLKQGSSFILSMNMEGTRNTRPREESTGDTVRTNTMAFYNTRSGFNRVGPDWPEQLNVVEIGKSIPGLYNEQGKVIPPESRLLELQRRSPEEMRQQAADGRTGRLTRQQLPSLNRSVFTTIRVEGQRYRVMGFSDGIGVFMAAHNMNREQHDMQDLRQAILLALPGASLIMGLIAW